MAVNFKDILLLGLKQSVTAFHRADGTELWKTILPDGSTQSFISLISDTERVYATCRGVLHCLNLQTGDLLWSNPLKGYGFGIGSLCLPEAGPNLQAAASARIAADAAAAAASSSNSGAS